MADQKSPNDAKIVVKENGPYVVSGALPLSVQSITPNEEGGSWTWTDGRSFPADNVYALCRCGESAKKPFCDGTHTKIAFDGTETASREPFASQAKAIAGPTMTLHDAEPLCAFARFCDNSGGIWELVTETDKPGVERIVLHEENNCPSGRLVLRKNGATEDIEPDLPASLVLVEDPQKKSSGPIWARGGIALQSQDGSSYETRSRVTLCRCGKSSNKPFCDGTHVDVGFDDGMMA